MARAMRLARQGWYTTRPNPRVGCVIVRNGQIVGEGFHQKAGEPHAEMIALAQAGQQAAGSTVYVTLEPCSHYGRTPPCSSALIAADVARVVIAMTDPNPAVFGRGIQQLRDAGIEVIENVLRHDAEALNAGFIKRMQTGMPRIRIKMAMSLDGRTAMASGESQWITGPEARADVHRMRAESGALLTGYGTASVDNPSLTYRTDEHPSLKESIPDDMSQPLRVVCDSQGRLSPDAKLLAQAGRTLLVATQENHNTAALQQAGAELCVLGAVGEKVPLEALMRELGQREINDVMVEAGPGMTGALISENLLDELVIYMAPHLMGDTARGLVTMPGLEKMADRRQLEISDVRAVGRDWKITAKLSA